MSSSWCRWAASRRSRAAAALAIIVVPVVVRTTEDMLLLVPNQLREAAASIGAPRSVDHPLGGYKAAQAGIVTGILLAIARVERRDGASSVHGARQPEFQPRPEKPDGEPAAHHQSIRLERLSGVAVARLDGCFDHHGRGLAAQHRWRACSCRRGAVHERFDEFRACASGAASSGAAVQQPVAPAKDKVKIENLNFFYGQNRALKDITLSLRENEVTAFIGPSGCGKSTLLRVLQPHLRALPRSARRRRPCCSTARISSTRSRTGTCSAPGSAWSSRSRRLSRCRSTRTSPSACGSTRICRAPRWTSASSARCAGRRCGTR